jgi:hypothetical protein
LIKNGGRTLKQKPYKLTLKIWHVPTQWNEGILCSIYKTGDML